MQNNHNSNSISFHRVRHFRQYANVEWATYEVRAACCMRPAPSLYQIAVSYWYPQYTRGCAGDDRHADVVHDGAVLLAGRVFAAAKD